MYNSLDKCHLNYVCTQYICDKGGNARGWAKWQWNALDWCNWIAPPASPVVQSSYSLESFSRFAHTRAFSLYWCTCASPRTDFTMQMSSSFHELVMVGNELLRKWAWPFLTQAGAPLHSHWLATRRIRLSDTRRGLTFPWLRYAHYQYGSFSMSSFSRH